MFKQKSVPALRKLRQLGCCVWVVGVLCPLILTGCGDSTACQVYIAVDGSGSTDQTRQRYFGLMDALMTEALPIGARVNLWRFDTTAREVYSGTPSKPQDLWGTQDGEWVYSTNQPGTRPDKLLRQLLADLPRREEQRLALVMLWDGENTGKALTQDVAQLAADRRLRAVWLVGVDSQFRTLVKSEFQSFGRRLVVSGLNDAASGLETFRQLLEEEVQ